MVASVFSSSYGQPRPSFATTASLTLLESCRSWNINGRDHNPRRYSDMFIHTKALVIFMVQNIEFQYFWAFQKK